MMLVNETITNSNINKILNEFAKQYKKCCGNTPAEIIIVGGGSIVINYQFRNMTQDLDVILKTASGVKDAIFNTSEKLGLPEDWMNTDFKFLSSYSDKLEEVSKYYRCLNNGTLEIRTIQAEYLIAMKMQSGREYGNDIPDIIGIIKCEKEKGNSISYETIIKAGQYLYSDKFIVSESLLNRVNKYCKMTINELQSEYEKQTNISENIEVIMRNEDLSHENKASVKQLAQILENKLKDKSYNKKEDDSYDGI